ncbi:hypothetical protein EW145_g3850 [Phellinidium pouzarii]|uniref:Enoyl reductase (ER) domain-containing protein n=1 Tax=Phellinidium pouzarii TaxID=167371 RepID=A0A4S4L5W5_9AGAM|nr:hypothetical protein EW145_g3850 [Phellinidium pouzarii]
MSQMRAILVKAAGRVEDLFLGEAAKPKPSAKEILVKVKAFGLNRMDIIQRKGAYPIPPGASKILGVEFSGQVADIGSEVTQWNIEEEVFGLASGGAYAEYIRVPETHVIRKPSHLSWADAASIPENWLTAYQALITIGKVKAGEDVLIHAGASGVGIAASQLARLYGAKTVTATASTKEKLDFVLNLPGGHLGATHVVNYKTQNFAEEVKKVTNGKGVDVVIDFVGQTHWQKNIDSLAPDGRMTLLAFLSGAEVSNFNLAPLLYKRLHIEGSTLRSRTVAYQSELISQFKNDVLDALIDGKLKAYIHKVYPWTEIQEAHHEMETDKNIGKIIAEVVFGLVLCLVPVTESEAIRRHIGCLDNVRALDPCTRQSQCKAFIPSKEGTYNSEDNVPAQLCISSRGHEYACDPLGILQASLAAPVEGIDIAPSDERACISSQTYPPTDRALVCIVCSQSSIRKREKGANGAYNAWQKQQQLERFCGPRASASTATSHARSRRHSTSKGSRSYSTPHDDRSEASSNSIPHLREALNSLETQMADLMFERRMLETRLEQAVRQQSPVLRLPRELLGSIFVIGVHHMGEEDALLLSTLMLVCKEWTEIASNTPVLWSRITIDNHKSIPKARRKLARSKAVPLDISIQFGPQTEGSEAVIELVVHALDLLRPAIWRWRSFRLAVPTRSHAHAALAQCREPAPLLEVLAVQVHQVLQDDRHGGSGGSASGAARATASLLPLFQGRMPRLRTCAFTSFNFGWDVALVSRLRVLRLGGFWNQCAPSVATIVSVLRACPGLEELALRNMSDVESGFCSGFDEKDGQGPKMSSSNNALFLKESEMICLPRLRKASFYYAGIERMQAVFSQMLFPALERVEFSYMDNVTPIIKHLKRQSFSSLPLAHLRIESCFFNELKLVRLLQRLPTLNTLELVDVEDISSNFLNGLSTPAAAHEWICPNLETLNFDGCSAVAWDALRALVEARLPASAAERLLGPPSAAFTRGNTTFVSSASAYAAQQHVTPPTFSQAGSVERGMSTAVDFPKRLQVIDLTRCNQISKEMVQWLRMYVAEVRCESAKTYWGEFGFSP